MILGGAQRCQNHDYILLECFLSLRNFSRFWICCKNEFENKMQKCPRKHVLKGFVLKS